MSHPNPNPSNRSATRLVELLALAVADDLSPTEALELELLKADPGLLAHASRTLETLELVMISQPAQPEPAIPDALRQTLVRQAREHFDATRPPSIASGAAPAAPASRADTDTSAGPDRQVLARFPLAGALGWFAAAAAITIAAIFWPRASLPPAPETPASIARAVDSAPDAVTLPFKPGTSEYQSAKAQVVWSDSQQRGYLRLSGIAPNDPRVKQFQLWIVDPARDARPVDGGVFDVASSTPAGDVIIPITSRLPVTKPTTFAITVEKPGGVVVSGGPMVLIASRS